jgi:taurine---2-oxoglutarate transaminase
VAGSSSADAPTLVDDHVFHPWSVQGQASYPVISGGDGAWFWDLTGRKYLDFASQLVNLNLGHQHPALVAAIVEQAQELCMVAPGFGNPVRSEAARLIGEKTPADLNRVFFTNGGAEANENAIRMARIHTGRHKILSMYRSYHGATYGAITLTGEPRRWGSEPGITGIVRFFGPHPYRSSFWSSSETEESERALAHVAEVLQMEGPDSVAAIIVETVVGTNGVIVPPPGYLAGLRELCDRHEILLIADEVMVGFGRTGAWFAVDHWDVVPDLITFAKGVNSGYVPLGGVAVSEAIFDTFRERSYPGGLTYSGHPLACAVAVASIKVLESEGLVERTRRLGEEVVRPTLEEMKARHPSVGDVRGLGLFWAIELVRDRAEREMLVPFNPSAAEAAPLRRVVEACHAGNVWPFVHHNRLHVAPPLVISESDLRQGLEVIEGALAIADEFVVGS